MEPQINTDEHRFWNVTRAGFIRMPKSGDGGRLRDLTGVGARFPYLYKSNEPLDRSVAAQVDGGAWVTADSQEFSGSFWGIVVGEARIVVSG